MYPVKRWEQAGHWAAAPAVVGQTEVELESVQESDKTQRLLMTAEVTSARERLWTQVRYTYIPIHLIIFAVLIYL